MQQKMAKHTLVIAPRRVATQVWPNEKDEWLEFQDLKVIVLHGPKKDTLVQEEADFYVITPEGLEWFVRKQKALGNMSPMEYLSPEILVVDESSKFKHTQSARFKNLKPLLGRFDRRYTLTGSPAPNGYIDIFGQVYITDMGRTLGPYISHFRDEYFDSSGFGGYTYELREGADKLIHKAIKPVVYRVDSESELDLPEFVPDPRYIELPKSAMDIYVAMEKEYFAVIDRGEIGTAINGAVARGKCCQIANGGLYIDIKAGEDRAVRAVHTEKVDDLVELRESIGGKQLLIAYHYDHDFDAIQKALGGKVPYIGGGISDTKVKRIMADWNTGKIRDLMIHPASGGHGLNLQKSHCQHVYWYNIPDDYDLYDQTRKRVRRQGNGAKHVFEHFAIVKDTVDIPKYSNLGRKGSTQKTLMDAIKAYRKTKAINKESVQLQEVSPKESKTCAQHSEVKRKSNPSQKPQPSELQRKQPRKAAARRTGMRLL
jgi:SNF2 family DNA or RNA helicase